MMNPNSHIHRITSLYQRGSVQIWDVPCWYTIPGPARLADIAPLAQALWRNAVKTSKGEGGETLRRPDLELTDQGNIS